MRGQKPPNYLAKPIDANGNSDYTEDENHVWHTLITRQRPLVEGRACDEYMRGLHLLNLPNNRIPQCHEISTILHDMTGWRLEPVPALIPSDYFFSLLAEKKFPAATFIRRTEDLDYIQEPDIFHEIFGHCPMLTNPACADFSHAYGQLGLQASADEQMMLARLYWFTIEFGLIRASSGLRAYGGGILSSKNETVYCVESKLAQRKAFDVLEVLRTPYRIDIMQPIYFVIESFNVLYQLIDMDLIELAHQAQHLGMHTPVYSI